MKDYAERMTEKEVVEIREKIYKMADYQSGVRLTLKTMAAYLIRAHPNLIVDLTSTSSYKDTTTRSSRLRTPGSVEYRGYHLKVWTSAKAKQGNWRYPNLINHDTTETYRYNAEVAEKIVEYEKRGKKR